jgi:hypothetical protein
MFLVNFCVSYFIDTLKHWDKRTETREQTWTKPGMETAKNAGQLFRLFNLVEFITNQGISTRYQNTEHYWFTVNWIFYFDLNAAFALFVSGIKFKESGFTVCVSYLPYNWTVPHKPPQISSIKQLLQVMQIYAVNWQPRGVTIVRNRLSYMVVAAKRGS